MQLTETSRKVGYGFFSPLKDLGDDDMTLGPQFEVKPVTNFAWKELKVWSLWDVVVSKIFEYHEVNNTRKSYPVILLFNRRKHCRVRRKGSRCTGNTEATRPGPTAATRPPQASPRPPISSISSHSTRISICNSTSSNNNRWTRWLRNRPCSVIWCRTVFKMDSPSRLVFCVITGPHDELCFSNLAHISPILMCCMRNREKIPTLVVNYPRFQCLFGMLHIRSLCNFRKA